MGVDIKFKFPDLYSRLQKSRERINIFIAAQAQFNRGQIFDKEGAYNGRSRWAGLQFRNGQILSNRGTLRKSIAPFNPKGVAGPDGIVRFASNTVTIGTKLGYARLMNDGTTKMPGGVLRPVRAKALKIPIPQGSNAGDAAKAIQKEAVNKQISKLKDKMAKAKSDKARNTYSDRIVRLEEKRKKGSGPVKFIFRKSVKIPARPFDDWTSEDEEEMAIALANFVNRVLSGKD